MREPANDWVKCCKKAYHDLEEEDLEKVLVDTKPSDFGILTHCVMEGIQFAWDLEMNEHVKAHQEIPMPGYIISKETGDLLESGRYLSQYDDETDETADVFDRQIPREYNSHPAPPSVPTPAASRFYGNNTSLNPVKADLSKKASICMIARYRMQVRKQSIRCWKVVHPDSNSTDNLPAALIGCFFLCDGQPVAQPSKLIAIDNRKYYIGDDSAELPDFFPGDVEAVD